MKKLAVAFIALLALGGCAEATATNEAPSVWDAKSANPRFVEAAQRALGTAPQPEPGWRVGVILAEQPDNDSHLWLSSVLTSSGVVMVGPDPWSSDCDHPGDSVDIFPLMLDPGDLITWAGDDRQVHAVCAEDMRVLRKAAA